MPRLWTETIETHRQEVRDAILESAASLVAKHGLLSVTMSEIAEDAGIGRATLYKYFPDVESILIAWHERHVSEHLEHLKALGEGTGSPLKRLEAVLLAYAQIQHRRHTSELSALLHRDQQAAPAAKNLRDLITALLVESAEAGDIRSDVPVDELAVYCINALGAAAGLKTKNAVDNLVLVTLAGVSRTSQQTSR